MDLLIKGVKVFRDGGWKGSDIAIAGGKISEISDAGKENTANTVYDFTGRYASAGWVDLHTHVYPLSLGGIGTTWQKIGPRTGVTGLLDVGTTGADNFEKFRDQIIAKAEVPIRALLNVKKTGIRFWQVGRSEPGLYDLAAMERVYAANPELIAGVKVTASKEHMLADNPMFYVEKAIEAGERLNLPVMVHFGRTPPTLTEMLPLMRQGDILTHCLRGGDHHIIGEGGKVRADVREAEKRGVLFDVGHGVKSFAFKTATAALADGFDDFTISSDLYMLSTPYRAKNLAHVLTKFLELGMSLEDVMERASTRPARIIGLDRVLAPGHEASLTVFDVIEGDYHIEDCWGENRTAKRRVKPVAAIIGGKLTACV